MAMFSESGLVASGYKREREKMYLCEKCGRSLTYTPEQGYCCPVGHGCWWPRGAEQKVIREQPDAIYAGGDIIIKGGKPGGKRNKKLKNQPIIKKYLEL